MKKKQRKNAGSQSTSQRLMGAIVVEGNLSQPLPESGVWLQHLWSVQGIRRALPTPEVFNPWAMASSKQENIKCQLLSLWLMFHTVQLKANKYFSKKNSPVIYVNVTDLRKPLNSLQLQRSGRQGHRGSGWFIPSLALPEALLTSPFLLPALLHTSPLLFSLI